MADHYYVTLKEIAALLHVSRATAKRRVEEGTIPGKVTLFGRRRVKRQVFENWLKMQDL